MQQNFWNTPHITRHCNCDIYVDIFPKDKKGNTVIKHAASLRCRTHNMWIKWLTLQELADLEDLVDQS